MDRRSVTRKWVVSSELEVGAADKGAGDVEVDAAVDAHREQTLGDERTSCDWKAVRASRAGNIVLQGANAMSARSRAQSLFQSFLLLASPRSQ